MKLEDWLAREAVDGFSFDVARWIEHPGTMVERLAEALGREVVENYMRREWLERRLRSMGYERLAEYVRQTVLPPAGNTRTGDFGEIVATFVMRRHLEFFVPVLRLRYKDSPSGTQRLIDLVAFKFREPPDTTTVAVSEVKTLTAFVTAGAGFLLAVLWFDLMFDVQALPHRGHELPEHTLASIAGYYRRVTTTARPMNRLVARSHAGHDRGDRCPNRARRSTTMGGVGIARPG